MLRRYIGHGSAFGAGAVHPTASSREVAIRTVHRVGVEVVVDLADGRVVIVWRRGWKP